MSVADNIRAIRIAKGLSQAEVARRYGTSPEFYHRLEKKQNQSISWDQLIRVADALGVTHTELIGLEAKPNVAELHARIEKLESDNNTLRIENEELKKEQDRLNETLGFVRTMMDLVKGNPQQIKQLEDDIFDGDAKKKERIKKKVVGKIMNPDKDTK